MFRANCNGVIVGFLLLLLAQISVPPTYGATESTRLHVVLIGDTEDESIGESVSQDLKKLHGTLNFGIPECRLTVSLLSGKNATRENVLAHLRQLDVQPDTSLFVYYSGHGVVDPKLGHVMTMKRGNLVRKELLDEIRRKKRALVS